MKIEGPSNIRYTGKVSTPAKSAGPGKARFSDQLTNLEENSGVSGAAATSGIMGIEQIIGLQEVEDATTGRKRAKARATEILDSLDEIRVQILDGTLSPERLAQLARVVNARRADVTDPKLLEVLDEIDLRAQVELAKFQRDKS